MYPKFILSFVLVAFYYYFFHSTLASSVYASFWALDFGYLVSVVAWFFLDAIPIAISMVRSFRPSSLSTTLTVIVTWCVNRVVDCAQYVFHWVVSLYHCSPPTTFLVFWRYPQSYYCEWYNTHYSVPAQLSYLDYYLLLLAGGVVVLLTIAACVRYRYDTAAVRPFEGIAALLAPVYVGTPYDTDLDYSTIRGVFHGELMPSTKPHTNHSHGQAAAYRLAATSFLRNVAKNILHKPWSYQMSASEQRHGVMGSRFPMWVKDLHTPVRNDPLVPGCAVIMVDVDCYVDMPRWLAANFKPHLIFTFQPRTAGKVDKEYAYSFKNDIVTYEVKGGGKYTHPVWNYQQDAVSATSYFLGFWPVARATYLVERRAAGGDHEAIMLLPLMSWGPGTAWISHLFVSEAPLRRFTLAAGFHNRLRIFDEEGVHVSTAASGSTNSITIPAKVDEEILTTTRLTKLEVSYPTVAQILSSHKLENLSGSKTLTDFARSKVTGGDERACVPTVQSFQYVGPRYDPDAKPSLTPFMDPLALPAFAPNVCYENEDKMAKGRVVAVQNEEMQLSLKLDALMNEFIEIFIPDDVANTFHPTTYEEVLERQNRPSQRRIIAASEFDATADTAFLNGFMKKEPQGSKDEPGHPRPIVIYEGDTKVKYSQFTYALADYLKGEDWYAFGKTPADVAETMVKCATDALFAASSDGSRWDGRVSNLLRMLETRILSRFFASPHQEAVHRLHKKQYLRRVRTPAGVQYDLQYSRGSGSPETSVFNSIENKFIAYIACRSREGAEHEVYPKQAYYNKGLYGGDDGITFGVTPRELIDAATMVGQSYASEPHMRGESIKFLSRYYSPTVWYGNPSSACDLDRAMRNFNCTVSLDAAVTPVMKLLQKAKAYCLTDAKTPYLGDFVSAVARVAGDLLDSYDERLDPIVSWLSRYEKAVQYPNDVTRGDLSWINAPPDFDADAFTSWIAEIEFGPFSQDQKLQKFLKPPYCDARRPVVVAKEPVVVSDTLCIPPPPPPVPQSGLISTLFPNGLSFAPSPSAQPPILPPPMPCTMLLSTAGTPISSDGSLTESAKKFLEHHAAQPPFVPCAKCLATGKKVRHSAKNCWEGKPPAEVAALKKKKSAEVPVCKVCTAKGKPAKHDPAHCFDGKTPAQIAKIKESWKKK